MNLSYIEWVRSRVGKRKIILCFASVVLFDEQGAVLLQHRTDFDVWGLPGGIQELGESIVECAHRELAEETGLTAGTLRLVGIYSEPRYDTVYPNGDQVQQYTLCFTGRCQGGEMRPDGLETSEQRFFAPDEIPYDDLSSFYRAMIGDPLQGGDPAFLPPESVEQPVNQIDLMRTYIPREPFIGVGSTAVVVGPEGRLLMGRRRDDGEWGFPGGYMHLGENAAAAAVRETREETGLDVTPERVLGVFAPKELWTYPNGDQVQAVVTVFRCRPSNGHLQADGDETLEVAWVALEDALELSQNPLLADLTREVIAHLGAGFFTYPAEK